MNRHLSRYLLAAALAVGTAPALHAIKADPKAVSVKQPDGTTLLIRIHGDENFHYVTTSDGFLIARDADGFFKYVKTDASKRTRKISTHRANNVEGRTVFSNFSSSWSVVGNGVISATILSPTVPVP